jgi:hypothetical protein
MAKNQKTYLVGRNAETGEFTTVREARRNPNDYVVERVPKSGYGDVPNELKSVVVKPPKSSPKKSSTAILKSLRYEIRPKRK